MLNLGRLAFPHRSGYALRVLHVWKDKRPPKHINVLPSSKYGGEHLVTLLTGDSTIGRQGASYIRNLIGTTKVPVMFERIFVDDDDLDYSKEYIKSVTRNRCAMHVDLSFDPQRKQKTLLLNNNLNLYACIVKMESVPGYNCRFPGLKLTALSQNNTGDFTKLEYEPVPGVVETLRIRETESDISYLRSVFDYAVEHCHSKITIGHKRDYLPYHDGRFVDIALDLVKDYPNIEVEPMEIDVIARELIENPKQFDVLCNHDRYGTFVTSICAAVCGGASLFGVREVGPYHAVFKPLQTKLSLTDCRELSPYGIVRACIDMLRYLGNEECANVMQKELDHTMIECEVKTAEFGGTDSGDFVICNIVNKLKCKFAE